MYIEYSLRGLLSTFFKHFGKIVIINIIVIAIGFLYVQRIEKVYDSTASILIKFGENSIPDLQRKAIKHTSVANANQIMKSYVKILQSRDLLRPVIYKIGTNNLYPPSLSATKHDTDDDEIVEDPIDIAINRLVSNDMQISLDTKSSIINIRILNKDPVIASKFLGMLIKAFIQHQNKIYGISGTEFIDTQILSFGKKLKDARLKFMNFKQYTGIYDLDKEIEILLSEKSALSTISYNSLSKAQEELAKLRVKEAEMLATYKKSSPYLKSIQHQISVLEEIVEDKQYYINSEEVGDNTLALKLSNIDQRIKYLEEYRPEYEKLEQLVLSNEDDYNYFKQRGSDEQINDMLQKQNITRFSIIEHPVTSVRPVPTKKKLIMIAFLLLGIGLSLSVALFFELLDDRINNTDAATSKIKYPILEIFNKREGV